ncbi:Lrp/AsnC family transcriptional regulator [Microbacterium sp. SORGH_AS_0888]|uniref:Lrp/AsnC family transcriptional regulator n=1 Tax=Microbacterium sp. SORGH_AS_0888 TaxID=3041791 RepID=UPI002783EFAB|nr:Lrp/AsnC ligand binding domain-containing protein [Microbacterium sp. SORGH_AS_0888]MDQ1129313.1 DNA-binding Lrp family transcriptional regulator [Microbacterium sp. SORGH_AS_0888]
MNHFQLDELDYQIVNALQVNPRITWTELSRVLVVDSSTLSRRWGRLVSTGLVWTTCLYMPTQRRGVSQPTALVEVCCTRGEVAAVAERLAVVPQIFSVNATSGDRQLYLIVGGDSVAGIDTVVREQIERVDGVAWTRVHYIRSVFHEGGQWRMPALSETQQRLVAATRPRRDAPIAAVPTAREWALLNALKDDVRQPLSALQRLVPGSPASIARAVDGLLVADWAHWRVDIAHGAVGFACAAVLWIRAPYEQVERIATAFRMAEEVRMVASVAGAANLVVMVWLRDLDELEHLERRFGSVFPRLDVADIWIVPRAYKRAGWLLDANGLKRGRVPFDEAVPGEPLSR